MQFCRSVDGVRFWALRDRNLCFFMLISRWFVLHFGVILHDFELPSGSLISVCESSSKQLKTRNFHHFLKRFLRWKNRVTSDVWWIFWKMRIKFGRKKVIHFVVICIPESCFLSFLRDLEKNVIPVTIWEYRSYNFRFWAHPKMSKKRRFPECRWIQRRAKWGQNSGLGRRVIFSYSKIQQDRWGNNWQPTR